MEKIIRKLKKILKSQKKLWLISLFGTGGFAIIAIGIIFVYFYIFAGLPSPYTLKNYKATPLSSQIYDRNGKLLYEVFREENRTPVDLKKLPDSIKQATIAVEDKDFYRHGG
ncbi:MAG: hypothetical protein COU27_01060, partial [Candidatus Levybacteria bacterium CG10_big_fil_rev_8_21_14_0_10_36_7]